MTVRRTMNLRGALVDARLTGGTARVVIGASLTYIRPAAIQSAPGRRWVPRTDAARRVSGKTLRRAVVACADVRHPRGFSGLGLLAVLTIDLDKACSTSTATRSWPARRRVRLDDRLFVASQKYVRRSRTAARCRRARARRSPLRRVEGRRDDVRLLRRRERFRAQPVRAVGVQRRLRVASTEEPQWFAQARTQADSESFGRSSPSAARSCGRCRPGGEPARQFARCRSRPSRRRGSPAPVSLPWLRARERR